MPAEEYHSDRSAMSSTGMVKLLPPSTPLHFHYDWTHGETEDDDDGSIVVTNLSGAGEALRFGSICHMALLEPKLFRERFILEPVFTGMTKDGKESTRSGEALEKKKKWYAQLPKRALVVTQKDFEMITGTVHSILGHPKAAGLLEGAKTEISGWARHPGTGVLCRIRPDILRIDKDGIFLSDFKTSRDASRMGFSRQMAELLYHVRLAFYHDMVKEITGDYPRVSSFMVAEKKAPNACAVYALKQEDLEDGRARYNAALELYAECLNRDIWPSYQTNAEEAELPTWFKTKELPLYDFEEWSKVKR